jgi:hypothetical protein
MVSHQVCEPEPKRCQCLFPLVLYQLWLLIRCHFQGTENRLRKRTDRCRLSLMSQCQEAIDHEVDRRSQMLQIHGVFGGFLVELEFIALCSFSKASPICCAWIGSLLCRTSSGIQHHTSFHTLGHMNLTLCGSSYNLRTDEPLGDVSVHHMERM